MRFLEFNAYAQLQIPGGSFKKASVTLTIGGNIVLIEMSKRKLEECRKLLNLPEEG